jgi:hypothetical protein
VSTHKTTLGAPLTDDEYEVMQLALARAKLAIASIPLGLEPHEMLQKATLMIECGFNLRDHIQRGLNAANQRSATRLVGGYRGRNLKVVRIPDAMDKDISDITKEDIEEALKLMIGVQNDK